MTRAQQAVLLLVTNLLLIGALTGLYARRRIRLAYFFVAYLVAIVALSSLVGLWPARFHTWSFYWTKESIYSFLKVGTALELTVRVFQAFPAAARAARVACLLVLAITVVAAWTTSSGSAPGHSAEQQWANLVLAYHPRITNGTAWLFGAMFALILYYRLPLHSLHKAIAFGFMSYLLLLTFVLDILKRSDFAARGLVSYTNALGYTLLAAYWAWAAWRKDPPPPVDPEVVQRLQPWREPPPGEP